MAIRASDLPDVLSERQQQSEKVMDRYGGLRERYDTWHRDITDIYALARGDWSVVWPDKTADQNLPKVPNLFQITADDRARQVVSSRPSLVCRPEKMGDKAKARADKRERILGGYWEMSRIWPRMIGQWAHDGIATGICVAKVLPDLTKPTNKRFPMFHRIDPAFCYPDPIFTPGPWLDSMVIAYEEKIRTVEARFGVGLGEILAKSGPQSGLVKVIEYYDAERVIVIAENPPAPMSPNSGRGPRYKTLLDERHNLECTPVVIGTRVTMDGTYRGELTQAKGIMKFWNQMQTLVLDNAINTVWPMKGAYDVENPEEFGPDALLEYQSPNAKFEYIQPPNQAFSNLQLLRDVAGFARAAVMLPPSRSGDPNESIISASGISATQSQNTEDVKGLQRDMLSPMLEAANELAFTVDVTYCDAEKSIYGQSHGEAYEETYTPSKDIGDYRTNKVIYGMGSGLDEINTNVLVLQQLQAQIMSRRTAMEQSPFIEDPQRESKQRALEQLDEALLAGMIQSAQAGTLDSGTIARIRKAVEDDETPLHDAIVANTPVAPLAPPTGPGGATPGAPPGIAGAGRAQQPAQGVAQTLPPLAALLGR